MADLPAYLASTFAERKKAREAAENPQQGSEAKQVDDTSDVVEDKAVKPAETKRPARKKS